MARPSEKITAEWAKAEEVLIRELARIEKAKMVSKTDVDLVTKLYEPWTRLLAESIKKVGDWKGKDRETPDHKKFIVYVETQKTKSKPRLDKRLKELQNRPAETAFNAQEAEYQKKFGPLAGRQRRHEEVKKAIAEQVAGARNIMTMRTQDAEKSLLRANQAVKQADDLAANGAPLSTVEATLRQCEQLIAQVKSDQVEMKKLYDDTQKDLVPHRENKGVGASATYGLDGSQVTKKAAGYVDSFIRDFADMTRLQNRLDAVVKGSEAVALRAKALVAGAGKLEVQMQQGLEAAKALDGIVQKIKDMATGSTAPGTSLAESSLKAIVEAQKNNEDTTQLKKNAQRAFVQQGLLSDAVKSVKAQVVTANKVYDRLRKLPSEVLAMRAVKSALGDAQEHMSEVASIVKDLDERSKKMNAICGGLKKLGV